MTKEAFKQHFEKPKSIAVITGKDLKPYLKDRTLLYGYNLNGYIQHVYLKDMEIHTVTFPHDNQTNIQELDVAYNKDYIPSGFLYPEKCDLLFCQILQRMNLPLHFSPYKECNEPGPFFGPIL